MAAKSTKKKCPSQIMVVNDSPGEECRIAILEDGKLEELYSERIATATGVGNIYKGRVTNVEPAIQAAFVDYGAGQNGFLHISDLHPRYFPRGDKTERVGKKIPRRDRPPIQDALKRGDSVLVQVIKEGIGTKGPTLTSYLSIPGRLMVMMPDMDRVGVSRKIEDEDKRREMRKVLDSLDLPEGMGFILRTAGFGRTKTDLKRDLAYLNRLWKTMESRIKRVQAPCPLYVESDLLIRTIRDVMSPSIEAIIVDSQSGYDRATEFLSVIAPRSAPQVIRYCRASPIFHTFDIERQIDLIHKREVPLPSGGAIVIDQTEALVAIDVNSGRSRSARDSETNAYQTNTEATDEICRQLRLRDLGGLVCCDLIDMFKFDHRKAIEKRFRENLSRDRAKTTVARISEFGVLELTRQRMRPGLRKAHYQACSHCDGRGEVRTPDSMASEATRFIAYILQYDRVNTVEVVCSSRVASVFLSGRRRDLVRLEDESGKKIRIRVSDSILPDRVDYYAYDDRNADIDITRLPTPKQPSLADLAKEDTAAKGQVKPAEESAAPARKKRRRRRKKVATVESAIRSQEVLQISDEEDESVEVPEEQTVPADSDHAEGKSAGDSTPTTKKRRRRRRKKAGSSKSDNVVESSDDTAHDESAVDESAPHEVDATTDGEPSKKRRRRRRKKTSKKAESPETRAEVESASEATASDQPSDGATSQAESDAGPKKKRRRRSKKKAQKSSTTNAVDTSKQAAAESPKPSDRATSNGRASDGAGKTTAKKPRRALYGSRRRVSPVDAQKARERE